MTVSLLEILAAARAHAAPLAAESAGYLLLAVTDHVAVAPRVVSADDVELMPDGNVRLRARRGVASDVGVEQVLRQLLARTLEVSSSVGPALRRAAQRSEDAGLPGLVRELETALIPVNRSAAKRALSRLHRETERAKSSGKLAKLIEADAVQAEASAAPLAAPPVVAAPPIVEAVADSIALLAEYPEPSPIALPVAAPLPAVVAAPARPAPKPVVHSVPELTLTPEPRIAVGEPAFTKPEPVVQRAKERGNSTPRLGTLVTLQTLPGEEAELLTERAPAVVDDESELDLCIDVELEPEVEAAQPLVAAEIAQPLVAAEIAQPLVDPEPSRMPDVLTAMMQLHTGVDADDAPTRIRDVVTELRVASALVVVAPAPVFEPTPLPVAELTPTPALAPHVEPIEAHEAQVEAPRLFVSELAEPALHEALTWNPGPVAEVQLQVVPPALLIAEPEPELSPYAPAVLPARQSDVSELLDSFYVSDAAEERELRSALKGMAGLDLTPMPHPYVRDVKEG